MSADTPAPDNDETPEYPLPSPTDPLSRDQLPPDDDEDIEATPDDPDIAGDDASGTPS